MQAVNAGVLSNTAAALSGDAETAVASTSSGDLKAELADLRAAGDAVAAMSRLLTNGIAHPAPADPAAVATAAAASVAKTSAALDTLLSARIAKQSAVRTRTLLLTSLGLVLAGWAAAAVWWQNRHDVRLAVAGVSAIAGGDLTAHPLPTGLDEFGDIGRAIALARDRLIEQEAQLAQGQQAREEQLRASFTHQREAEKQVRARAQGVIDETASSVIDELGQVVTQVDAVRTAATTIDERVSHADTVTTTVVAQAEAADRVLDALGQSLRRVAGMAQVISGVADQTKLLALNASIEAARAGAAGRGFSVVANEVKDLAMTTAKSTEQISATIGELEKDASAMASAITDMSTGIRGLDEATGVLGNVATQQHHLVESLDNSVSTAIDRVRSMTNLTQRLERRRAERVSAGGQLKLDDKGRVYSGSLLDISVLGAQCSLPAGTNLRIGDVVNVELPLGGTQLQISARIARRSGERTGGSGEEYGLEFVNVPDSAGSRIQSFVQSLLDL